MMYDIDYVDYDNTGMMIGCSSLVVSLITRTTYVSAIICWQERSEEKMLQSSKVVGNLLAKI